LYSVMGAWGTGIALVFLVLIDLVLMQKISVAGIAGRVREQVNEYRSAPRYEQADRPRGGMYLEDVTKGSKGKERAKSASHSSQPVADSILTPLEDRPFRARATVKERLNAQTSAVDLSANNRGETSQKAALVMEEMEIPSVSHEKINSASKPTLVSEPEEKTATPQEEKPSEPVQSTPLPKIELPPIEMDEPPFDVEENKDADSAPDKAGDSGEEEFYNYPPIDLLAPVKPGRVRDCETADAAKAQRLEDTLRSFGVETRLTGVAHGPAVTRFELKPAPGIKVSRITSLADDIALNLAAVSVRIEAPIPGKDAVGVEVPNDEREIVQLREVLESGEARKNPSRIAVGLGKDNAGRFVIADIAKMPHVLIAGATGSGKSVCINSIICSILYRASPAEVRLILIDPKVVELSVYNDIPHLLVPVVTDPRKAASALQWAVCEMTDRYKKFAAVNVRNIKGYNAACPEGEKPMPQIVIIIDELADLMLVAPGEVEDSIQRLTQLARAAGIHLVIATQRPSVNVITGVIKANIPVRIAFQVASQVDSRTILDAAGAEKLLGNGDMLYATSTTHRVRVQGAWVSDEEVQKITRYIIKHHEADYNHDVIEHMENADVPDAEREQASEEYDELLPKAIEIAIDAGQASISMLQRKLKIGYARAGRLIDDMATRGIVSPSEGAKPREVLMTREQFHQMFGE